ncbi:MAG: SUMF1/EgtB/PvdO family nonheme iron enzyme [Treponema sp.]|nr:SUMF1/EgtB/PvdO family nonheme iron enzyme [Treponema sp.]
MIKKQPHPEESEDRVRLKPFLGMRPGVYLTVIYSFIILLIIFFLLVFPGLRNPGSVLIAKTQPAGAAIRVNDVYMGTSGNRIFLPNGTYIIEAVMPGFEKQAAVHTIKGRIFASLFFPRKEIIEFTFATSDPMSAFAVYAADFSEWTFGGEPTSTWQVPLSLSEGAYRTGPYAKDELNEILIAASRFTSTRSALRDLIRAKALLDNLGNAPSPSALLSSVSGIIAFLSENPGSAQWILSLLPANSPAVAAIESSQWFKNSSYSPSLTPGSANSRRIDIAGLSFTNIPPASIESGGNLLLNQNPVKIKEFYISDNAVSKSLFETFLEENPQWKDHYTNYYPQELSLNPMENRDAVTGVTWYASDAFCKWLSGYLPPSLSNMEIRLPSEDEWSAASLVVSSMRNPGWLWCADPYVPLPFIFAKPEAIEAVSSPERSLRGRQSYASIETRASLPPDVSSPFVTFRPVIAERK